MENKEILLSILNEMKNGKSPIHTDYNLNLNVWVEFIEFLNDKNCIADVTIDWFDNDDTYYDERFRYVDLSKAKLTAFRGAFLAEEMN